MCKRAKCPIYFEQLCPIVLFQCFPATLHKRQNLKYLLSVTNTQCQTAAGQLLKVTGMVCQLPAVFRNWPSGGTGVMRSEAFVRQTHRPHWRYLPPLRRKTGANIRQEFISSQTAYKWLRFIRKGLPLLKSRLPFTSPVLKGSNCEKNDFFFF